MKVSLGSIFVWSCEAWILSLVYMCITLGVNSTLTSNGRGNVVDTIHSIFLFLLATLNVIGHLAIGILLTNRKVLTPAHGYLSSVLCSLFFVVCWNYIILYLDTCLPAALSPNAKDSAMCTRSIFSFASVEAQSPALLLPSVYGAISAAFQFILFFITLALGFSSLSVQVFVNRPCLYAASIAFALSLPTIKLRTLRLCDGDRAAMETHASAFLGVAIPGVQWTCCDEPHTVD